MIISWVDCQETSAKQRQFERQALAAREWFKQHGPLGAPVFPIGYAEREELKMGGLLIYWEEGKCVIFDAQARGVE